MKEISSVKKDKDGRDAQVNSIYMMAHSGARGSPAQMRQLAGMRGLMAKPSGEIIETPIISNFKEGLSVLEYFNSTHGARKGLADTALEDRELGLPDAASGRRRAGLHHHAARIAAPRTASRCAPSSTPAPWSPRWRSAFSAAPRPRTSRIRRPARSSSSATRCWASRRSRRSSRPACRSCSIRSVLTCELTNGVCGACYGRDLARGTPVNMGEAVGVIAAQSIGEPGTQLTMRTFHIGGAAQISEQSFIESNFDGKIEDQDQGQERRRQEHRRRLDRHGPQHRDRGRRSRRHRAGRPSHPERRAAARRGRRQDVKRGQRIAEWDPYTRPILTEAEGTVAFEDLVEGQSMSEAVDESTGIAKRVVIDWRTLEPRRRPASPRWSSRARTARSRSSRAAATPATCWRSTPSCRSISAPR